MTLYYVILYHIRWPGTPTLRRPTAIGKGQTGSALMGSLRLIFFFDRGTFWVLPLTCFYPPKSDRAYHLSKFITFAAAPLVLTPFVRNQGEEGDRLLRRLAAGERRAVGAVRAHLVATLRGPFLRADS